jgi:hypothetical protein
MEIGLGATHDDRGVIQVVEPGDKVFISRFASAQTTKIPLSQQSKLRLWARVATTFFKRRPRPWENL